MKKVVDTNCLQSEALRTFLSASPRHQAVLPDFVAMELYACLDVAMIHRTFSVLADFPDQVLLLKPMKTVMRMSGRSKGLQRRLIDEKESRDFPRILRSVEIAMRGDRRAREQLLAHAGVHRRFLASMVTLAERRQKEIPNLISGFTKDERAALRECRTYSSDLVGKVGTFCTKYAVDLAMQDRAAVARILSFKEFVNTFVFRWGVCDLLNVLRRAALGDGGTTKPKKIRNDMIDMLIVANGTFFDGVLSGEANVNVMWREAMLVINGMFDGRVFSPPWKADRADAT